MYRIDVGEEVTLARPVFQGAWGILGGTRCRVLAVTPPQKPEQPTILTLTPVGASNGLALRAPAQETMEGVINILEAQAQGLNDDILVFLEALNSTTNPGTGKAILEQCLLKMSSAGRNLALGTLSRTDKAPAAAQEDPEPSAVPKPPTKKPKK